MPAATGWLVEPDDSGALANALELALAMPDEARARLALRARRFATRNFSLEQMGAATMKVYRELLEERGRDPGRRYRGHRLIAARPRRRPWLRYCPTEPLPSLDRLCAAPHFPASHRSAT